MESLLTFSERLFPGPGKPTRAVRVGRGRPRVGRGRPEWVEGLEAEGREGRVPPMRKIEGTTGHSRRKKERGGFCFPLCNQTTFEIRNPVSIKNLPDSYFTSSSLIASRTFIFCASVLTSSNSFDSLPLSPAHSRPLPTAKRMTAVVPTKKFERPKVVTYLSGFAGDLQFCRGRESGARKALDDPNSTQPIDTGPSGPSGLPRTCICIYRRYEN